MRPFILALLLSFAAAAPLFAQAEPAGSALAALKALPRGEAKRLALIAARDGTPVPERWHFIVHDPKSETGVHEYVVAGGEIVASRDVSQFAENVRPEEVIAIDALKINSDRAAKLAQQYASANNAAVATMHYELKKDGAAAAPLWSVLCLDEAGKELGRVVVSAGKGTVISHPGFAAEPPPPVPPLPEEKPRPPEEKPRPQPVVPAVPKATPMPVVVAEPVEPPPATPVPKKPGLFERMGSGVQKIFTPRDKNKRPE